MPATLVTLDLEPYLAEGPIRLHFPHMTPGEFWDICRRNPEANIELTASGEVLLMQPAGGETGGFNARIIRYLDQWAEEFGGYAFDSSAGFTLPSGAVRSPDATWISAERWEALTQEQRESFAPIAPDFVVELMSPSGTLNEVQAKMEEYIENGVRLGWLIDRKQRTVSVYRPEQPVQILRQPTEVSANPELPGFVLPMRRIF